MIVNIIISLPILNFFLDLSVIFRKYCLQSDIQREANQALWKTFKLFLIEWVLHSIMFYKIHYLSTQPCTTYILMRGKFVKCFPKVHSIYNLSIHVVDDLLTLLTWGMEIQPDSKYIYLKLVKRLYHSSHSENIS